MTKSNYYRHKDILSKASYLIVALFLLEGIIGKSAFLGYAIHLKTHVLLTLCLISTLIVLEFSRPKRRKKIRFWGTYRRIQHIILSIIIVGFVGSLLRIYWKPNLIFCFIWAANFYAIWWSIPRLMNSYNVADRIRLIKTVLIFVLVASSATHLAEFGIIQGRLGGIFANPTIAARLIATAFLIYLVHFIFAQKHSKKTLVIIGLSLMLLIMTKTRASIFATFVGTFLIILIAIHLKKPSLRRQVYALLIGVCVIGSFLFCIYDMSMVNIYQQSRRYLRLEKDFRTIYLESRAANWRSGYQNLSQYGLLGLGFMSKFGITDSFYTGSSNADQNIIPHYNWNTADDPLNMLLSVAKQQGWIASILYIWFLVLIIRNTLKVESEIGKFAALAIVILGLVFGFLDGNWMTSFGDPVDRISMVTMALMLSTTNTSKKMEHPRSTLAAMSARIQSGIRPIQWIKAKY